MRSWILDAWAVMCWLQEEPGAGTVAELLEQAGEGRCSLGINVVNLGEAFYNLARRRGLRQAERDVAVLRKSMQVLPAREELVLRAAALKATHRISYADGFAAATAMEVGAPLVTGDPELLVLSQALPQLQLRWLGG